MNELFKERVLVVLALLLCVVAGILGSWDAPEFSPISVVYTDPSTTNTSAFASLPSRQTEVKSQATKININTASQELLETLPRIGKIYASRIIEYRETYGGFDSIEEIMNVSGIGKQTFETIKELITVD